MQSHFSADLVCLDTETTGLRVEDGERVIEIGCVRIRNRKITGEYFHTYLNPGRKIQAGAQAVHGISDEFLRNKPSFDEVVEKFLTFISGAELVIHNAPFDVGFLNAELNRCVPEKPNLQHFCKITDSLALARQRHPGQKNNLDALCNRYDVDISQRELHGALLDAQLLARVFLAMTGGQSDLFMELQSSQQNNKSIQSVMHPKLVRGATEVLPIIAATGEEMLLHEAFLRKMRGSDDAVRD